MPPPKKKKKAKPKKSSKKKKNQKVKLKEENFREAPGGIVQDQKAATAYVNNILQSPSKGMSFNVSPEAKSAMRQIRRHANKTPGRRIINPLDQLYGETMGGLEKGIKFLKNDPDWNRP